MKLIRILGIIFCFINFQINITSSEQYVLKNRALHTATLIGKKIYFLGGLTKSLTGPSTYSTNDFFTLDVSKWFNQSEGYPYEDLSNSTVNVIPVHNRATTSVGGHFKDSIFLFDGDMGRQSNYASETLQSFSTSQQTWENVEINFGEEPLRKTSMNAATDNNGKVYLFGGAKELTLNPIQYFSNMDVFDTINKSWQSMNTPVTPRDGYTATYIPESNIIIYIGGFGKSNPYVTAGLIDMSNLDIYNTVNNSWGKLSTKDPPKSRVFHTAVLTNDHGRIIVFGGADYTTKNPAGTYYEVLDVNTYQWYHSYKDIDFGVPYKGHTATLVDDYMFIAFGFVYTEDGTILSDKIWTYKIGDYADFELINRISEPSTTVSPSLKPSSSTEPSTKPSSSDTKHIKTVVIAATISSSLVFVSIIIAAFVLYKRYKRRVLLIE
ncbi:hypothetical protein RclHR1_01290016 [Rhizophagus clarus]|uniref:Attractin/MKLN-like beta-propeller domain-containing protein n=1 Tax=Rhizophagus clarus TaxID=94130 RepID=A0A2Z6QD82_9GLOM|nr:hypothetical protein RclHR1_01290016 [Rhizophagus clarus]GES75045.1 hypothetical protein GLOIN_2v1725607 [Rhizophagus clarus]